MTHFLPLAAIEVVATTRRAVTGARVGDPVEPAPHGTPEPTCEPDRRPRRRLTWLGLRIAATGR